MNIEKYADEAMGLYEDIDGRHRAEMMDFGRLKLGVEFSRKFYLINHDKKWPIQNIRLSEKLPEDMKIELPQILMPGERFELKIEFLPSLHRRDPLDLSHLITGDLWIG